MDREGLIPDLDDALSGDLPWWKYALWILFAVFVVVVLLACLMALAAREWAQAQDIWNQITTS